MSHHRALLLGILVACAGQNRAVVEPAFTATGWRIRLEADSVPLRISGKRAVEGTVDLAAQKDSVNFLAVIGRTLPARAEVVGFPRPGLAGGTAYKITMGDPASDHEKVVLWGVAIRSDSIVGTWSETAFCCTAGGRFVLWRVPLTEHR